MKTDLTAKGQGNSPARQAAGDGALAGDTSGRLQRFRDLAASSAVTTNADFTKVLAFEDAGKLLDGRGYRVAQAGGNLKRGLAAFAAAQGAYFARRENFEDLWEHGRSFIYGAVNAGGMGVEDFGPICLVIPHPDRQRPQALGVFPADTLQRYTSPTGVVNQARALTEATAWDDRADLAVVERRREAQLSAASRWALVLCRGEHYLEVAFAGQLPLAAVSEARLRARLRERLDALSAKVLLHESLTSVEENEVEAYDALQRWRRQRAIRINDLP